MRRNFCPGERATVRSATEWSVTIDSPHEFDLVLHPDGSAPQPAALGEGAKLGCYLGAKAEQPVRVSWNQI